MRKFILFGLLLGSLALTGCGDGKPDVNDPKAVADYLCQQTTEMMELVSNGDDEGAVALLAEVDEFEAQVKYHHKDNYASFMSEMENHLKENCEVQAPNI